MNTMNTKTERLVGMGILTALIIVLQTFASGFKIANFSPPLSLIPIIVGAILFGEFAGAILVAPLQNLLWSYWGLFWEEWSCWL